MIYITLIWHFEGRQPFVQELKLFLNEVKEDWKSESQKLDTKFDAIIALEWEKLALEREKFEFQKQQMALKKNTGGGKFI